MCIFILHGTLTSYAGQVNANPYIWKWVRFEWTWNCWQLDIFIWNGSASWFWPKAKGNSKYLIVIVFKLIFNFKNELVWIKVTRRKAGIQAESFRISMTLVNVNDEENLILAVIKSEIFSFLFSYCFLKTIRMK